MTMVIRRSPIVHRLDWVDGAYLGFLLFYAGVLLINPHMDVVGYEQLREQIIGWDDTPPIAIFPEIGRFYPMFSMEYRLLGLFSPSILGMYVLSVVQFLAFAFLLYQLLKQTRIQRQWIYLLCGTLFLTPGFTNVWVGFAATERNVIFLMAALLFCHARLQKKPRPVLFAVGLVCANLALYYKEPVFLLVGVYAGAHLAWTWRRATAVARWFDALLVASALLFLIVYLAFIFPRIGETRYGASFAPALLVFSRNFVNYILNDPLIMILHLPLVLWRLYEIHWRRSPVVPVYDAMLLAGFFYLLAFLKLNIYATNYLLPVYIFTLPAAAYFLAQRRFAGSRAWRGVAILGAVLTASSAIPLGLHILTLQKYIPVNTVRAMDALAHDIRSRHAAARPSVFLDGVQPDISYHAHDFTYDRDAYFNLGEALKRRGVGVERFDLKSDLPPKHAELFAKGHGASYSFSVFQEARSWEPVAGDYLVVTPMSAKNLTPDYLASLQDRYELIFRTAGDFVVPDFSLRAFIRFALKNWFSSGLVNDANFSRRSDYYIFIRK